ncbi:hypothetical protein [Serratia sp. M24T3]|uniref:hypothetical protein n=1 Tax=Serratia sp. M24T3 TaxID=932213 RepID=UPI00025B9060|nr:hypothetical protein [Serratia sp. M24T3]EIC85429.1 hypothetical protein SPM24T3_06188 [Serratia sp. M24T3]
MEEILSPLVKYIIPFITTLIAVVALFKGWVFPSDRLFDKQKKLSKFSYELYKISGEEHLKELSVEYGYAAITKELFLTKAQRIALIKSKDPTRDIDLFRKCSSLLTIRPSPLSFEWKAPRHKFKLYRGLVELVRVTLYFGGAYLATLPLTFNVLLPERAYAKFLTLSLLNKWLLVLYIVSVGAGVALTSLHGLSKLTFARELRKRHLTY